AAPRGVAAGAEDHIDQSFSAAKRPCLYSARTALLALVRHDAHGRLAYPLQCGGRRFRPYPYPPDGLARWHAVRRGIAGLSAPMGPEPGYRALPARYSVGG